MIMKKKLLLIILMMLPLFASADPVEIDGIFYNLNTDGNVAEVLGLLNTSQSSVVIPETVKFENVTYDVTSIGAGAFYKYSKLTSVTIPNSVTNIGAKAFIRCKALTSITIPNSVTSKKHNFGVFNILA